MENYIITEKDGKLLGAYFPTIMGLFVNASIDKVEKTEEERYKANKRVYFHELFHNWQSLFTPFGQLRWFTERYYTDFVVNLWAKKAMGDSRFRKVPIAQLKGSGFDKGDMFVSLMELPV